jgi:predicted phage-related endonuclease
MLGSSAKARNGIDRRSFIGGSDARIIMGDDEKALLRLWREKRGEAEPEDLSDNLVVQLGIVTEDLNRLWYQRNTGKIVTAIQRRVEHPVIRFLAATLDGMVEGTGAVFESKFMLPWSFSEEGAAEKYMAQLQHNMWLTNATTAALSIITGGGKWVELTIPADSLYQHLLLTAEKKFWRCVETGEPPRLFLTEAPRTADRSRSYRRHEFLEFMGGIRGPLPPHPPGLPGTREGQSGAEAPHPGGCQGSNRSWDPGEALPIRGGQL